MYMIRKVTAIIPTQLAVYEEMTKVILWMIWQIVATPSRYLEGIDSSHQIKRWSLVGNGWFSCYIIRCECFFISELGSIPGRSENPEYHRLLSRSKYYSNLGIAQQYLEGIHNCIRQTKICLCKTFLLNCIGRCRTYIMTLFSSCVKNTLIAWKHNLTRLINTKA